VTDAHVSENFFKVLKSCSVLRCHAMQSAINKLLFQGILLPPSSGEMRLHGTISLLTAMTTSNLPFVVHGVK